MEADVPAVCDVWNNVTLHKKTRLRKNISYCSDDSIEPAPERQKRSNVKRSCSNVTSYEVAQLDETPRRKKTYTASIADFNYAILQIKSTMTEEEINDFEERQKLEKRKKRAEYVQPPCTYQIRESNTRSGDLETVEIAKAPEKTPAVELNQINETQSERAADATMTRQSFQLHIKNEAVDIAHHQSPAGVVAPLSPQVSIQPSTQAPPNSSLYQHVVDTRQPQRRVGQVQYYDPTLTPYTFGPYGYNHVADRFSMPYQHGSGVGSLSSNVVPANHHLGGYPFGAPYMAQVPNQQPHFSMTPQLQNTRAQSMPQFDVPNNGRHLQDARGMTPYSLTDLTLL